MKLTRVWTFCILILGFVLSMSMIMPSGSQYCYQGQCGVFFWGAHEHDSVWHLAVINNLFSHYPFQMPNMSGTLISGYNYLMDIVIATLDKIIPLSSSTWYFKILPPIWFGLMSYLSLKFARTYHKDSKTYPIFVLFFVFFGSSFSYLLNWHRLGSIWGSSSVLSMQSAQAMLNPQFAWSLIPILLLLIGLNQDKRSYRDYLLYGFYGLIAMGLKFYTGAAFLVIVGTDALIQAIKSRKITTSNILKLAIIGVMSAISVMIFYSPGKSTGLPFSFKPLATVNPIIEDQSLFYLSIWAQRLYEYTGLRLVILELIVLLIFTILNYGSRIFGILANFKKDKSLTPPTQTLLVVTSLATFLLSILLVQRGVWWNTVQFLYVSLFLSGLLAASGMDKLFRAKGRIGYALIFMTILLTIPNNLDLARSFIRFPGTGYISQGEIDALSELKTMDDGVVLTPLFEPRPQLGTVNQLPRKYDTGYVSAYSSKQTYLTDLIQLQLTNVDYASRKAKLQAFDCSVLSEVKYIYEYKDSEYVNGFSECGTRLERVIENQEVSIYRVN